MTETKDDNISEKYSTGNTSVVIKRKQRRTAVVAESRIKVILIWKWQQRLNDVVTVTVKLMLIFVKRF